MGTERVSELSAHNTGVEDNSFTPISYQKLFEEACPWYMSIGMSYDEFWYGDAERAIAYRKAEELRKKRLNEQLWLQGMYFYEALCDVSPILVSMPKKDAKIQKFSAEPYALTVKEQKAQEKRENERKQREALNKFTAITAALNNKFNKGGGNGG